MAQDNPDRFHIETLTKAKAQKIGHIAWIEEKDPAIAIRKMMRALERKPCNGAVWVNADKNPEWRTRPGAWRREKRQYFHGCFSECAKPEHALIELRAEFARAAREKIVLPPQLEKHVGRRTQAIFNASRNELQISFELRMEKTRPDIDVHIDGNAMATRYQTKRLRFLEVMDGASTFFVANKDAHKKGAGYVLKEKPAITVYEAPPNSLTLISNEAWAWQPLMHSWPFHPPGKQPQDRTVLVWDCVKTHKI